MFIYSRELFIRVSLLYLGHYRSVSLVDRKCGIVTSKLSRNRMNRYLVLDRAGANINVAVTELRKWEREKVTTTKK